MCVYKMCLIKTYENVFMVITRYKRWSNDSEGDLNRINVLFKGLLEFGQLSKSASFLQRVKIENYNILLNN